MDLKLGLGPTIDEDAAPAEDLDADAENEAAEKYLSAVNAGDAKAVVSTLKTLLTLIRD